MSWASVGSLGSNNDKTSGSSIQMSVSANAEAGNVVVVAVAKDNAGTSDSSTANEITSVTDSTGLNTWVKAGEWLNAGGGTANSGVVAAIFYSKITSQISSGGDTITANFSDSRTASAISAWEFTIGAGNVVSMPETPQYGDYNAGTDFGSLDITTANEERLWFRADGWEGNNDSGDSYTKTSAYDSAITKNGTTGSGAASNITIMGEFDIYTGTSNASDPAFTTTSDKASVLVALKEAAAPTATQPPRSMHQFRMRHGRI